MGNMAKSFTEGPNLEGPSAAGLVQPALRAEPNASAGAKYLKALEKMDRDVHLTEVCSASATGKLLAGGGRQFDSSGLPDNPCGSE